MSLFLKFGPKMTSIVLSGGEVQLNFSSTPDNQLPCLGVKNSVNGNSVDDIVWFTQASLRYILFKKVGKVFLYSWLPNLFLESSPIFFWSSASTFSTAARNSSNVVVRRTSMREWWRPTPRSPKICDETETDRPRTCGDRPGSSICDQLNGPISRRVQTYLAQKDKVAFRTI